MYGCESRILTEALIDKLEIFARTRSMLSIKQSLDHVTNQSLYHLTHQKPLRKHKLKLTGHYHICMVTDEPANYFVVYEFKIMSSLQPGEPSTTYLNRISSNILSREKANEIGKMAVKKSKWSKLFIVSKKKKPSDQSQPV